MLKEFMGFLKKFNVIPVAVGLVLALAFAPVVEAVVDLILQIVGKIAGTEDPGSFVADLDIAGIVVGPVLQQLITFTMIAFVVFLIVKSLNKAGADTAAAATPDQALLTEIRDLLKK